MVKDLATVASIYFDRFSYCEKQLDSPVSNDLGLIVVIPCFNEVALVRSLQALSDCDLVNDIGLEVISVVNHSENAFEAIKIQNNQTFEEAQQYAKLNSSDKIKFHTIKAFDLPKKHAGVGLARKIGMDEALRRFAEVNRDGIVVCFDADSQCDTNYFTEITKHFKKNPKTPGCSIHFEHPIKGDEFEEDVYQAIVQYELHLRYYKNALKFAGFPFAYHTIGSSMAVRASAYAKQGGMNKRKAGEDFYFLNKIMALGNFSELSVTKVIPSPRISDRVPFGTGKAVGDILTDKDEKELKPFLTYNFLVFIDLKKFCELVFEFNKELKFSHMPNSVKSFIEESLFTSKVSEIAVNTTSDEGFVNRFFKVFDAFWVLKFVHYARDNFYPNQEVLDASSQLLIEGFNFDEKCKTEEEALFVYRELDR